MKNPFKPGDQVRHVVWGQEGIVISSGVGWLNRQAYVNVRLFHSNAGFIIQTFIPEELEIKKEEDSNE